MDSLNRDLASLRGSLSAAEFELAQLMVTSLGLEIRPEEIEPTGPLFGDGLGLDSIDVLEVALSISKQYGVRLRSDDEASQKVFSSLRSLSEYVQAHRTR